MATFAPAGDCGGPVEPDVEPLLGQPLGDARTPLHDGHGFLDRGVDVEVVELDRVAEPVGVDMHQRRAGVERGMDALDHEGG